MQQNVDKFKIAQSVLNIKVSNNVIAFLWKGCQHPDFKCNEQIKLFQNA